MTLQFSCGAAVASHGSLLPHRDSPAEGTARPGSICKAATMELGTGSVGAGQEQAPVMPSSIWHMDLPGWEWEEPAAGQAAGPASTGRGPLQDGLSHPAVKLLSPQEMGSGEKSSFVQAALT